MTKICEICGKEFEPYSTGKYCSKECRKAGLLRKLEENRKRKAAARKRNLVAAGVLRIADEVA